METTELFHTLGAKKALTEKEAAEYINMSQSFLRQDRLNGIRASRTPGPVFTKIGRTVRYLKEDLDTWLAQHRVERVS
jgi:predicted DNA-binding transcriptional regulator AlpA